MIRWYLLSLAFSQAGAQSCPVLFERGDLSPLQKQEMLETNQLATRPTLQVLKLKRDLQFSLGRQGQPLVKPPSQSDSYYQNILDRHRIDISMPEINRRWREAHRHFHTRDWHLNDLLNTIEQTPYASAQARDVHILAALFHDIIWLPGRSDNEQRSAAFFRQVATGAQVPIVAEVCGIIKDTVGHQGRTPASQGFQQMDLQVLRGSFEELIEWEHSIFKEFQKFDWLVYREKRLHFLEKHRHLGEHIGQLIDYVRAYRPKVAVFAGTFSLIHLGHFDVLIQAERVFDKLILARGRNPDKELQLLEPLSTQFPFHQTAEYKGFLTDYLSSLSYPVTLVRGIRDGFDFRAEYKLQQFLLDRMPNLSIQYFLTHPLLHHISSSDMKHMEITEERSSDPYRYFPDPLP